MKQITKLVIFYLNIIMNFKSLLEKTFSNKYFKIYVYILGFVWNLILCFAFCDFYNKGGIEYRRVKPCKNFLKQKLQLVVEFWEHVPMKSNSVSLRPPPWTAVIRTWRVLPINSSRSERGKSMPIRTPFIEIWFLFPIMSINLSRRVYSNSF